MVQSIVESSDPGASNIIGDIIISGDARKKSARKIKLKTMSFCFGVFIGPPDENL